MLGIILVLKGAHSGKEVVMGYPNSLYKEELSYFDSVHYNSAISVTSVKGSTSQIGTVLFSDGPAV